MKKLLFLIPLVALAACDQVPPSRQGLDPRLKVYHGQTNSAWSWVQEWVDPYSGCHYWVTDMKGGVALAPRFNEEGKPYCTGKTGFFDPLSLTPRATP